MYWKKQLDSPNRFDKTSTCGGHTVTNWRSAYATAVVQYHHGSTK